MERKSQKPPSREYDNLAFHPYNVMLVLVLLAISALFLALSVAFIFTRVQSGITAIKIPWLFGFNTLLLLTSSAAMLRSKKAYLTDRTEVYQQSLMVAFAITLVFLIFQGIAWWQLFNQNIFLTTDNSAAYLYLLSGLHFAHVIAGLPFLYLFIRSARQNMKEPVTVLIYFSDPEKRLKLRLLSMYWHFLDGLWIFLVLFFLVNYWVK